MVRVFRRAGSVANVRTQGRLTKSRIKKHKVVLESVTQEKKKLRSVISFEANAPAGYTFIPAGNPQLTNACKEYCREKGLRVYAVTTTPHHNTHNLSQQVHRIGFHFPSYVVAVVCSELQIVLSSAGRVRLVHGYEAANKAQQSTTSAHTDKSQVEINTEARDAIKDLFPNIPDTDLSQIIRTAFKKGQRKVGTAEELPLARRVQLAVVAHIRHTYTDYDKLLKSGSFQDARSSVEEPTLRKLVEWRGDDENGKTILEDVFREVIVISDEEESEDELGDSFDNGEYSMEVVSSDQRPHEVQLRTLDYADPASFATEGLQLAGDEPPTGFRYVVPSIKKRVSDRHKVDRRGFNRYQAWDRARTRYLKQPVVEGPRTSQLFGPDHHTIPSVRDVVRTGQPSPRAFTETFDMGPPPGDSKYLGHVQATSLANLRRQADSEFVPKTAEQVPQQFHRPRNTPLAPKFIHLNDGRLLQPVDFGNPLLNVASAASQPHAMIAQTEDEKLYRLARDPTGAPLINRVSPMAEQDREQTILPSIEDQPKSSHSSHVIDLRSPETLRKRRFERSGICPPSQGPQSEVEAENAEIPNNSGVRPDKRFKQAREPCAISIPSPSHSSTNHGSVPFPRRVVVGPLFRESNFSSGSSLQSIYSTRAAPTRAPVDLTTFGSSLPREVSIRSHGARIYGQEGSMASDSQHVYRRQVRPYSLHREPPIPLSEGIVEPQMRQYRQLGTPHRMWSGGTRATQYHHGDDHRPRPVDHQDVADVYKHLSLEQHEHRARVSRTRQYLRPDLEASNAHGPAGRAAVRDTFIPTSQLASADENRSSRTTHLMSQYGLISSSIRHVQQAHRITFPEAPTQVQYLALEDTSTPSYAVPEEGCVGDNFTSRVLLSPHTFSVGVPAAFESRLRREHDRQLVGDGQDERTYQPRSETHLYKPT